MSLLLDHEQGWLANVRRVASPNCDARPVGVSISLLVIHNISLPPNEYGGAYIDQLFTNSLNPDEHPYFADIHQLRVSSHLLINRQGELTQYVPFTQRAWHAGKSEFSGCENCNDFSIGIELEGSDHVPYEQVQYQTLAEVTKLIMSHWPDITPDRITGHSDIAPGRKTDPGPAFDWQYYFQLIQQ